MSKADYSQSLGECVPLSTRNDDLNKFTKIIKYFYTHFEKAKVLLLSSPFGTGKTFFIQNLLLEDLKKSYPDNFVFCFNAWEYESLNDPIRGVFARTG